MSIGSDHYIDTVISIPETSWMTMVSEMMIAMQVKRWISEHVKARWMLRALNCRRDGCYMRWIREQLKRWIMKKP